MLNFFLCTLSGFFHSFDVCYFGSDLRRNLPVDLAEGVLRALCLQALGQVSQPTLRREGEARLRGASSKKGKCAKLPPTFIERKTLEKPKETGHEEYSRFGSYLYI